jgi:hypothetical protein
MDYPRNPQEERTFSGWQQEKYSRKQEKPEKLNSPLLNATI